MLTSVLRPKLSVWRAQREEIKFFHEILGALTNSMPVLFSFKYQRQPIKKNSTCYYGDDV